MSMSNERAIIKVLADGEFHSGEAIAIKNGISRAMVWKTINNIREKLNLEVYSVKGRGYKLSQPLDLLDKAQITSYLSQARNSTLQLNVFESIGSTNSWLMTKAVEDDIPSGTACLSEQQTAGRGRYGREWVSPYGKNICLSLLWRYPLSPSDVSGLSLAVGVTILKVLRECGVNEAGLKWPNDILWDNKKLAGLLLEVAGESSGPCYVVIGIGLNIQIDSRSADKIDQPWADLSMVPGFTNFTRNKIVSMILLALSGCLEQYQKDRLKPYMEDWKKFDLHYGKQVCLKSGNNERVGIHRGIDESGALILGLEGGVQKFHAGEVSLRSR
jgi:BirA family biotin operon repressor/biotin-[acetyl-CoA-carboxylase] ligase